MIRPDPRTGTEAKDEEDKVVLRPEADNSGEEEKRCPVAER